MDNYPSLRVHLVNQKVGDMIGSGDNHMSQALHSLTAINFSSMGHFPGLLTTSIASVNSTLISCLLPLLLQ